MTRAVWDNVLSQACALHNGNAALTSFCAFPEDLRPKDVAVYQTPAASLFAAETGLTGSPYKGFHQALLDAGPLAHWREAYKDTNIDQDFQDRFGVFCLIGNGGAFDSDTMRAWMVYMPANLHYTWHHHVAEEAYLIVAGSARFMRHGEADVTLSPGDTMQHHSNQPHAMETGDSPVLCYVIWRNGFDHLPVLTPPEDLL